METTRPISRADAARAKGVSRAAVSIACKVGGQLHAAQLDGGRIDEAHPAFAAWLSSGAKAIKRAEQPDAAPTKPTKPAAAAPRAPTGKAKPPRKQPSGPTAPRPGKGAAKPPKKPSELAAPPAVAADELDAYASLLSELLERFGTARNFRDWLLARKAIADIREKELKNEEKEGLSISRELVQTHVIGLIEGFTRQLLSDTPKTIARTLYSMARSSQPLEAAEAKVRGLISAQLVPVKEHATRVLE